MRTPRSALVVLVALVAPGCGGGPDPAPKSGDAPTSPATQAGESGQVPAPSWDEPMLELMDDLDAIEPNALVELLPQLQELVPEKNRADDRELDRFQPEAVVRAELGAGWETLTFPTRGKGDYTAFKAALEALEYQTRRLVQVRRVVCEASDGQLAWELGAVAYVHPKRIESPETTRSVFRRLAHLVDEHVQPSWILNRLSEDCADLPSLRLRRLTVTPELVLVEGDAGDDDTYTRFLSRLEGPLYAQRYTIEAGARDSNAFELRLVPASHPKLPEPDAAPKGLHAAFEHGALEAEVDARCALGPHLDVLLGAAQILVGADKATTARSFLARGLESPQGHDWAEGVVLEASLAMAAGEAPRAMDLLRLAQSLQWPAFTELSRASGFGDLRLDPDFLLDLLLAEREPRRTFTPRNPFEAPGIEDDPTLEGQLQADFAELTDLAKAGETEAAREKVTAFQAKLNALATDAPQRTRWEDRLATLGELAR